MYAGESSAPPPYSSVQPAPQYELPKSPVSNRDTEPILPHHHRESMSTETNVTVANNFMQTVRNTSFGTWFIIHSAIVSLLTLSLIVYVDSGPVQIGLLCYIFVILFAAFSRKISVLNLVIGIAIIEVIAGFGLLVAVFYDDATGKSIGIDNHLTVGGRILLAILVLIYIFIAGSQLYLAHKVLQIAKSQMNGVFVSVSTRISR